MRAPNGTQCDSRCCTIQYDFLMTQTEHYQNITDPMNITHVYTQWCLLQKHATTYTCTSRWHLRLSGHHRLLSPTLASTPTTLHNFRYITKVAFVEGVRCLSLHTVFSESVNSARIFFSLTSCQHGSRVVSAVALRPFLCGVCMFRLRLRGFPPGSPSQSKTCVAGSSSVSGQTRRWRSGSGAEARGLRTAHLRRLGLMQRTHVVVHHCECLLLLLSVNPLCVYLHSKHEVSYTVHTSVAFGTHWMTVAPGRPLGNPQGNYLSIYTFMILNFNWVKYQTAFSIGSVSPISIVLASQMRKLLCC